MTINESQLIEEFATVIGVTYTMSEQIIIKFKHFVAAKLREGKNVRLHGFGQFYVTSREPRLGRDPITGKVITIPARKVPSFRAGEALKKTIN